MVLGGTLVPLPDAQNLSADITPNGASTIFTLSTAGRYFISYNVNLTASLLLGSRLVINGVPNVASTISPVVSLSSFNAEVIVTLAAGSSVSLELFGLLGAATLQTGAGASLTVVRLDD